MWLHAGFLSVGDTLGLTVMQNDRPDLNTMYTVAEEVSFATINRYDYDRYLKDYHREAVQLDAELIRECRPGTFKDLPQAKPIAG